MKKSIIASAIAATVLSTSAFAAQTTSELAAMLESMPTVYGNIQLVVTHKDSDGSGGTSGLADNGSTIGFKHSHQINDDLKAFVKIEFDSFGADDSRNSAGKLDLDEAYIGVEGSFGKVWVGSDDSVYESFMTSIDGFENLAVVPGTIYSTGEGDLVQYTSSSMDGFQVFAALELDASANDRNNPFQLGLAYNADALTVAIAMDSNDSVSDDAKSTFGLSAAYEMDNLTLMGEFHTIDKVNDVLAAGAVYKSGANQYQLTVASAKAENDDKQTIIAVQALRNVSSNMYVYAEAMFTNDSPETGSSTKGKDLAVGVTYYF